MSAGRRIEIRGVVQGVGFRPWVYRLAHEAELVGQVKNDARGVVIEAFGSAERLAAFTDRLTASPPPTASISELHWQPLAGEQPESFKIVTSAGNGEERRLSIAPDLATCAACCEEVLDPDDRRHRYPFTNCTHCGPRFTIARGVPYDRPTTTMAGFVLCAACRLEYESPADRRFHAQPNACPTCGPRLELLDAGSERVGGADPLTAAARALAAGQIVAVKGIGGFHLACDATSDVAVARLRRRKGRAAKPFAVMVRDLAAARHLAALTAADEALLTARERPIVLVRGRRDSPLASAVAPGLPLVGLLLPYSPLHHLLLREVDLPLVMTSGNLSEEPIAYLDDDAQRRLTSLVDLFLVHDREIASRCDDSVARIVGDGPVLLRRSRGYVPRAISLAEPVARPILGCGAHLKNTFCLAVGDSAYLGPHVGDLDTVEAYDAYGEAVARLEQLLGVEPEVIAHDLHPDYLSTRYARERGIESRVAVQHHHGHLASAIAEHRLAGPVLGLIYDGTGYGTDGTVWGGEVLLGDAASYQRIATFRPLRLAGGERAIREIWRLALTVLDDAFDGEPPLERLALFRQVQASRVKLARQMVATGVNSPRAHGVGRYFDALGALVLARTESRYEGEVALLWGESADRGAAGLYPVTIDWNARPREIDLRPLVRAVVDELTRGVAASTISARFHHSLIAASERVVRAVVESLAPRPPVVLSGGCFANPLLAEGIRHRLEPDFSVCLHRQVPPGDGGIALGQVVVADAVSRLKGARSCA